MALSLDYATISGGLGQWEFIATNRLAGGKKAFGPGAFLVRICPGRGLAPIPKVGVWGFFLNHTWELITLIL